MVVRLYLNEAEVIQILLIGEMRFNRFMNHGFAFLVSSYLEFLCYFNLKKQFMVTIIMVSQRLKTFHIGSSESLYLTRSLFGYF